MSTTAEAEAPAAELPEAAEGAAVEELQPQPQPAEAPPQSEKKEKKVKAPKEKKPKASKASPHPPYFQMIKEALLALNEKGGSSPYAIAKHMEAKHKAVLPANFRKILGLQLKNSAARGKLIKIKASYKLSEAATKAKKAKEARGVTAAAAPKRKKAETVKKGAKKARKASPAKPKQPKSIRSPAAKRAKRAYIES